MPLESITDHEAHLNIKKISLESPAEELPEVRRYKILAREVTRLDSLLSVGLIANACGKIYDDLRIGMSRPGFANNAAHRLAEIKTLDLWNQIPSTWHKALSPFVEKSGDIANKAFPHVIGDLDSSSRVKFGINNASALRVAHLESQLISAQLSRLKATISNVTIPEHLITGEVSSEGLLQVLADFYVLQPDLPLSPLIKQRMRDFARSDDFISQAIKIVDEKLSANNFDGFTACQALSVLSSLHIFSLYLRELAEAAKENSLPASLNPLPQTRNF